MPVRPNRSGTGRSRSRSRSRLAALLLTAIPSIAARYQEIRPIRERSAMGVGAAALASERQPQHLQRGRVHTTLDESADADADADVDTDYDAESNAEADAEAESEADAFLRGTSSYLASSAGRGAVSLSHQHLSLETRFDGTNGSYGTMFDVTHSSGPSDPPVLILTMAIHANVATNHCPVQVFTKAGTHRGFETDKNAWTVVFDGTIVCLGFSYHSVIPAVLFSGRDSLAASMPGGSSRPGSVLRIDPGETRAFYVHMSEPDLRYTNGKDQMEMTSADRNIHVRAGTGMGGMFSLPYSPRHWNGVLYYETLNGGSSSSVRLENAGTREGAKGCDGNIYTTFVDTIGSYGNMFDVSSPVTSEGVVITGMEIYTDREDEVLFEVYTCKGSFLKSMSDLSSWSLVAAGSLQGNGRFQGTAIPADRWFRDLPINAGSVVSFYATLICGHDRFLRQHVRRQFTGHIRRRRNHRDGDIHRPRRRSPLRGLHLQRIIPEKHVRLV